MDEAEKQSQYERARELISEQYFVGAVFVGTLAAGSAAIAYGVTVATWPSVHGFAVAGIGIVVGLSTATLGRGITSKFSALAALFTIAACMLGNVIRMIIELARATRHSFLQVTHEHSFAALAENALHYISPIDFVYWFVAVFAAAFLARRPLSRSDRLALRIHAMKPDSRENL